MKIRVGFGFDVHQLVEGRELWLGGILLEHTKGLLGHSDADTDAELAMISSDDIDSSVGLEETALEPIEGI